ncbi:ral GTPase-activating protein subunit beta isoform X3 [Pseudoliparis swirei]|uniref:ral GTPase-activating protein subunit beta isoform X3 n=1 Tax=Pseudoliparis swirei TaxID=2059687 RepID=UPI0024BD994F|nr:ral GTPase-activating protein subunit beta isoform X3 [Pseudoliparis swirei]
MDQSLSSGRGYVSVLSCFPPSVGRDVAVAVVKPLRVGLGNPGTRSLLRTDRQVRWAMEALCYGLTLPADGDTVQLCVDVYTDWLTALVSPRDSIPLPIGREPNLYAQKILRHLYTLFLSRSDQVSPVYTALCQQVLCAVQSLARDGAVMSRDTWETLLNFLLCVNHAMLATGDVSEQLSRLSMAVLFEAWLLSCARCFPSRSLWRAGRLALSGCRRRPAAVEQWSRAVAALTSRLLLQSFGPAFPRFEVPDEDAALIPEDMDERGVPQTWFRFLHLLSNPVDLSGPGVVGSTPSSPEDSSRGDGQLPNIFFKAMRGVSVLVDAFLGVTVINKEPTEQLPNTGLPLRIPFRDRLPSLGVAVTRSPFRDRLPPYGFSRPRSGSAPHIPVNALSLPSAPPPCPSPPPPNTRLKAVIVSKATSRPTAASPSPPHWRVSPPPSQPPLCSSPRPSPSPLRCNVDSLLHLFGGWLFDAALINRDSAGPGDVTVTSARWAAGRAEACGTLCRIFTCKKTAEDILSVYLSRFYLVLLRALRVSEQVCPPVLASVLLNSTALFCCDLRGVHLLLPSVTAAVEKVLLDRELLRFRSFLSPVDLRRAAVRLLLTMLPLPFGSVQSEVLLDGRFTGDDVTGGSFLSLKPRLIAVLIGALQTETDTSNTQILLASMLHLVQDSSLLEASGLQDSESQPGGASRPRWAGGAGGAGANRWTRGTAVQSDAAGVLWVQFVRLLTQRLTSQWRNDSAVCLSALEVLGGLAKVEVSVEVCERRRAVSAVCCYIVFQCRRPPPLHSRDLHSIIVAAFYCLNVWLSQHPALLDQQDCLLEVLEIVELGISGSKSRQEQEVRCKEEKELNPASLRVKEAAEATLSCVMQVSGVFPSPGGQLSEDALIGCPASSDSSLKKFRYFVVDRSVILAMLEQPQGPEQAACPSLTVRIRGPSGGHTWTLQLHLQPREGRAGTQPTLIPEQRVAAQEDAGIRCGVKHLLSPEHTDRVASVKADLSIPTLRETVTEEVQQQLERLQAALTRQRQVEARPQVSRRSDVSKPCRPPSPITKFQTARLFLSHLGLLTPETLKSPGTGGVPAPLVSLDSSLPGFSEDLRRLDQLPSRNCDSAFIFYMRAGQRTAAEVLGNVESSCSVQSHFLDFLWSLGRPVEVGRRRGGGFNANSSEFMAVLGDSGGGVFNGERFVLMHTDALTEITFIVPSSSFTADLSKSQEEAEPLTGAPSNRQSPFEPNKESTPQPTSPTVEDTKSFRFESSSIGSESKLLIVWVERFEDIESFPLSDLLSGTKTGTPPSASSVQLIFVHPLNTGLYRIRFQANATSKFGLFVPLVNGSLVSRRSLAFLLRETVINCCHRRRLESDSAPPAHVRRKHTINDIILRYRSRCSEPAFYAALFQEP